MAWTIASHPPRTLTPSCRGAIHTCTYILRTRNNGARNILSRKLNWPVTDGGLCTTPLHRPIPFQSSTKTTHQYKSDLNALFKRTHSSSSFGTADRLIILRRNVRPALTTRHACRSWPISNNSSLFLHHFLRCHDATNDFNLRSFSRGNLKPTIHEETLFPETVSGNNVSRKSYGNIVAAPANGNIDLLSTTRPLELLTSSTYVRTYVLALAIL